MAVVKPVMFTTIHDEEVSLNRPSQEELLRKFFQNLNMLSELAIIGSIEAFALNQPGVESPDASVFQLSDGSEITDPDSPLKTVGITNRFTPDMRSRYLRAADASTNAGNEAGGDATVNLSHSHGGTTGVHSAGLAGEEGNDDVAVSQHHAHPINADLNSAEPLDPAYQQVAFYLKIN